MLQARERHSAQHCEEGECLEDGIQVHGEHQRVPRGRQDVGRAGAGDIPDRRLVGEAEPQLCRHLPAVSWQKGNITPDCYNVTIIPNFGNNDKSTYYF